MAALDSSLIQPVHILDKATIWSSAWVRQPKGSFSGCNRPFDRCVLKDLSEGCLAVQNTPLSASR